MSTDSTTDATERQVDLAITGMTCASCANRIQRKLNKVEGVTASVNYATEKASVTYDESVSTDLLLATVESAGYGATLPSQADDGREPDGASLRARMLVSAVLSVPVIAMAMVPPLQVDGWQWISLVLATPVVLWGALPFHRAAWTNLRHGATTMDTLISMGTLAAFGWSLYALVFGTAGEIGMTHSFDLVVELGRRTDGADNLYLEAATGVATFLLVGRYLEERAKGTAGAALRALLDLGARELNLALAHTQRLGEAVVGRLEARAPQIRLPGLLPRVLQLQPQRLVGGRAAAPAAALNGLDAHDRGLLGTVIRRLLVAPDHGLDLHRPFALSRVRRAALGGAHRGLERHDRLLSPPHDLVGRRLAIHAL